MKQILTLFSFILVALSASAQPPNYSDLRIQFADANYEKLVKSAEKYTLKDKTKKDPIPYFWMAKGLYEISLSNTDDDKYKNAYKSAIKYLSKGIKYDNKYNDGAYTLEEEKFLVKFQNSLYERVYNETSGGNFKRSLGWVIKYTKISNNVAGAKYLLGACKFYDGDRAGARLEWQAGEELLKDVESLDSWTEGDKNFLKIGILYSAAAMIKGRQQDKAKKLVGSVAQWFEEDDDWKAKYDEIVNNVE